MAPLLSDDLADQIGVAGPNRAMQRARLEAMWLESRECLDQDFQQRITREWPQRYWELYLAYTLLDCGAQLAPRGKSSAGPDFSPTFVGRRAFVEAVAPTSGQGGNVVPDLVVTRPATAQEVPDDGITLRLTSVLLDKRLKVDSYRSDGIVLPSDPVVIAVSGGFINFARHELEIPRIVRALLGIGHYAAKIDVASGNVVDEGWTSRNTISKRSGSLVSTSMFLDLAWTTISAVIYSGSDHLNHPERPGVDFHFIHNPQAINPLPLRWLSVGTEWWVASGELKHQVHGSGLCDD